MEMKKATKERKVIDVEQFFGTLDDMIQSAGGNNVLHLKRDKVALYLVYAMGLRPSEVLNLNVGSFRPATETVSAEGAMSLEVIGSGRMRMWTVPVLDDGVSAMLMDYMENVRPHFAEKANTDQVNALFLSGQGHRVSLPMLHRHFKEILEQAGLDEEGHALNSLRFTGLCDLSRRISLESMHRYTSVSPLKNSASTFRHQVFLSGLSPNDRFRPGHSEPTTGMYIPDPEFMEERRATGKAEPERVRKGKKRTDEVQKENEGEGRVEAI
jgi:hypothetical protein